MKPVDRLMLATSGALLCGVTLFSWRIPNALGHAVLVIASMAVIALVAKGYVGSVVHDWLPIPWILGTYFHLGWLIAFIHPFTGYSYDLALEAIDDRLLGNPAQFFAQFASKPLSELLMCCYYAYYPFAAAVPAVLFFEGRKREFDIAVFVVVSGFVIAFAGYALVPAVGPHVLFEDLRTPALDGYLIAQKGYETITHVPHEPPDAFPSGHALMGMLVPALAWRFQRPLFKWFLPIGVCMVVSTLYLRFHYVADVLASAAAAPLAWRLGLPLSMKAPRQLSCTP